MPSRVHLLTEDQVKEVKLFRSSADVREVCIFLEQLRSASKSFKEFNGTMKLECQSLLNLLDEISYNSLSYLDFGSCELYFSEKFKGFEKYYDKKVGSTVPDYFTVRSKDSFSLLKRGEGDVGPTLILTFQPSYEIKYSIFQSMSLSPLLGEGLGGYARYSDEAMSERMNISVLFE